MTPLSCALQQSLTTVKLMPKDVLRYTPEDCRQAILSGRAAVALTFETSHDGEPLVFCRFGLEAEGRPSAPNGTQEDSALTDSPVRVARATPGPADRNPSADAQQSRRPDRPEGMEIGFFQLPGTAQVYNNSIHKWESPPERALNRCVLTGFGGLGASVPSGQSETVREAACHLLAVLCRDRLLEAFPATARTACRESQVAAAENWIGQELTADERRHYVSITAESYRNVPVVAELPVLGAPRFRDALTVELGAALSGEKTPTQALSATAKKWEDITKEIGPARVRDSYRRRLGLHARPQ